MPQCSLLSCGSRKNLHQFPVEEATRQKWIEFCGEIDWTPGQKMSMTITVIITIRKVKGTVSQDWAGPLMVSLDISSIFNTAVYCLFFFFNSYST